MIYKKIAIDGVKIFYREAGAVDKPTMILFHGFPSSSHMFRDLIPRLEDNFHLYENHKIWQDVYHVPYGDYILYIKFTQNVISEFTLLSFKEK